MGVRDGPMYAGGSHARDESHDGGRDYGLPDGTVARLYGGMAYRWWAGTPGESELVAGVCQFWQAVPEGDRELFEEDLKLQVRSRVANAINERWGLGLSWASPSLERIEWLVIWDTEPDLLDRLHAYEAGYSAALPPGTRPRDLSGEQVSRLARRMGLRRATARGVSDSRGSE